VRRGYARTATHVKMPVRRTIRECIRGRSERVLVVQKARGIV
jgi:hypothetical protein